MKFGLGTVVELILDDGQIFNCMITEVDVKLDTGVGEYQYDYRGLFYPAGFLGFSSFFEFNHSNIHEVIFEPEYEVNYDILDISSIVLYQYEEYLVVGHNVSYAGLLDGKYACIKISANNSFDIVYLEKDELSLISDGSRKILDQERIKFVRKNLREFNSLLPIGSVVSLLVDEKPLEVSIIGRNMTVDGEKCDYLGVHPELGFRGVDKVLRFNMDNVYEVLYLGYYNDKEFDCHLKIMNDGQMQRR